ncbi:hypothetical protein NDU88_006781 [Pleurodeles waltl]|uniref:Uncharacterized protein n=1 Tax=Pleurodeles waltl TaxID=8319 RepID=A0AAV7N3E5_PLEWA|nr:hypothetical protein NDU88_006781 [Pleurodeles waltl]
MSHTTARSRHSLTQRCPRLPREPQTICPGYRNINRCDLTLGNDSELPVDRAHRTPGGRPKPGVPPRMLIMRMLLYEDKEEARKAGTVEYNGNRNSLYPDYGVGIQQRLRSFMEVKRKLRDKGLAYALLPLVRLRIDVLGKRYFFDNVEDVMQFIENKG